MTTTRIRPNLQDSHKVILEYLAQAWPHTLQASKADIAKATARCPRTVAEAIKALRSWNLIECQRIGRNKAMIYKVRYEGWALIQ